MKTIRASEIGTYLYCQRAWWYHKEGFPTANDTELAAGSELHYRHGRQVLATGCLRLAAYAVLLAGLVLLAIFLASRII